MKRGLSSVLVCTLLITGCATSTPASQSVEEPRNIKEWLSQQSRIKKAAVVGAIVGGLVGAAAAGLRGENPWAGAAVGATAGALVGFAVGKGQDRVYAQRDEAIREAGYDLTQGYVARVEEVRFDPAQPKPGQTATFYVRYLVVGPNPNEAIKVQMFRGLKYGEDYIMGAGPNEFVVPRGGGIVECTMPVTLPKSAPPGTYGLEALLEDPLGRFQQVTATNSLYVVAKARSARSDQAGV